MISRYFLILAIILISIVCFAAAQGRREYSASICHYSEYKNKMYSTCFLDSDLDNTPDWNPDKSEPPISNRDAITKSRTFLAKYVETPTHWQIAHINLKRVGNASKWVYEIRFECPKENCRENPHPSFTVFLKMDGRFIEPSV